MATELHRFPISEVFGPTLQGEGREVGMQCSFVRFAGCGFSCAWCDTKYSWDPDNSGYSVSMMNAQEIAEQVRTHYPQGVDPKHVILTGGDPALQKYMDLLFDQLPDTTFAVETQGQFFHQWMMSPQVTTVTVAPKLSNAMQKQKPADLLVFLKNFPVDMRAGRVHVKIVCFTEEDVDEAREGYLFAAERMFVNDVSISIGTHQHEALATTINRYRRIVNYCLQKNIGTEFSSFRILMQQHVLLWGSKRGV